jgi:acetyl-CoA C-acetyltransferase
LRTSAPSTAYIIAARRTALGRVGGLHRNRRLESLAAPVIGAVLRDARLDAAEVEEIVVGNATQGGNPARLIALAAGLPEIVSASTIDRQCGSGLDAILAAVRSVETGEASVVVAGGAESISTAPWRIAKPKSLYQLPHFIGLEPASEEPGQEPPSVEAGEMLSRTLGIGRERQDAWVLRSHLKAGQAREDKRLVSEIVPLRANVEEARDQSGDEPSPADLERLAPLLPPEGTLTSGNTSHLHDGAAFVLVVSEAVWERLGRPAALRLLASAARGVRPDAEAGAPIEAMRKLYARLNGFNPKDIGVVEISESSAAQALALGESLGLDDDILNPDGGAVVRGHPLGAAGAVLVVRLFTSMVRSASPKRPRYGVATLGTVGGMGLAALFERT